MNESERTTHNDPPAYRCEIVRYQLTEGSKCELCGTRIKHEYTIRDEHGELWRVGSECAMHYGLGVAADDMMRLARKALAEWRGRKVTLNVAETRNQYVTRRVQEMRGDRGIIEAWLAYNGGALNLSAHGNADRWAAFVAEWAR